MAILTEAELAIYAPSVSLTGDAFDGAIAYTQMVMESPMGANRPLGLTEFTEIVRINQRLSTAYPSYFPIAASPAITVEVRIANQVNMYHRGSGVGEWIALGSDAFTLNENGRIDLDLAVIAFLRRQNFYRNNEARLIYTAGFDFSEATPEVAAIKAIAGQILTYQQSPAFTGIKRQKVDKEYEVEFGAQSQQAGAIPPSYLSMLARYRPRKFF